MFWSKLKEVALKYAGSKRFWLATFVVVAEFAQGMGWEFDPVAVDNIQQIILFLVGLYGVEDAFRALKS